jgi:hypothetical protein
MPEKPIKKKGFAETPLERLRFKLATSSVGESMRQRTIGRRVLPSYVIVGAQKAGTTFLQSILTQHPEVGEPLRKEPNYFSFNYTKGEEWYRANFPIEEPGLITGDATTNYMFDPRAAERMARMLPDAKIIMLLREPVGRARSHHQMSVAVGDDTLPFGEAIAQEDQRLEGEVEKMLRDPAYAAWSFRRFSYRSRGLYLEQLKRLESFYPKDRILVMDSGFLFKNTDEALAEVEGFLGLKDWKPSRYKAENVAKVKSEVDEETIASLQEFFRVPNAELFEHLGRAPLW